MYIGNVTNNWLITSGGVIKAERIKTITIACLRYFFSTMEFINPTFASKYITIGNSKNKPVKNVEVVIIDI